MKYYLMALSIIFAFSSHAANNILDSKSCFRGPFENHSNWLEMLKSHKVNFNEERFLNYFSESKFEERKSALECVDFKYRVDDLIIEGYYVKPKGTALAASLPVVIFNRGGNAGYGYVVFGEKMGFISDIAAGGYIVIGSQYRGASTKFIAENGRDEFGGKDVNDVLALVELLKEIPAADPSRIALVGWSRGVMQSYLVAKQLPKVKAIISIAGPSDARKLLERRPAMEKVFKARIPDFEKNRDEALSKRSVIDWADELPLSPLLLVHGTADRRVSVHQSKELARVLSAKQHPHKLVIYQNDNHALSNNRESLVNEVHAWLKEYL
ncbi:S9 family peptidase [Alteromonas pelagimontana]|uniref:S9 family peptidase n=1 Tax=Alteromonas pelagimontana TaxID=1858656 RepID=A0A6M4MAI7_9ALTE|nr:prolyl oligopeptidase family serine peptidase [Alteromonas pelagimontana]QJR80173.1 S9 family peptidase [Alteromonas pelagimontana]